MIPSNPLNACSDSSNTTSPNGQDRVERVFCQLLLISAVTGIAAPYLAAVLGQPLTIWWQKLVTTFGYFTNVANLAVALLACGRLYFPRHTWAIALNSMTSRTAIAVYISMTGIVYHLLLAEHYTPRGIARLSDLLTHTVTPLLYIAYWLRCARGGGMALAHTLRILYLPLFFLLYWLLRGPLVGGYPYFFIDVDRYGYTQVLLNSAGLCVAAWLLGVLYWAIARCTTPAPVENDVVRLPDR